jgi:putative flippase GtrA
VIILRDRAAPFLRDAWPAGLARIRFVTVPGAGTIELVSAHRERFAAAMAAITRRLPFGLSEVVAPDMVGYLLINLCTFFIDLTLLGLFHGTFRISPPVAVTMSYGSASLISYVANRVLNFRSHADVGRQFPVYVAVSASNYLIFVLGLFTLLTSVGVYYELSRVLAACCEAVYLYCMMRWVVFRDVRPVQQAESALTEPSPAHAEQAGSPAQAPQPRTTEPRTTEPRTTESEPAPPGHR